MSVTLRIIVESVDDVSQKILSRDVIKNTPIKPVESIIDLGFRHQEKLIFSREFKGFVASVEVRLFTELCQITKMG